MGYYDHEPKANKGIYLRLKSKGEVATIRLASPPYREPVIWKEGVDRPLSEDEAAKLTPAQWAAIMRSPDYEVREAYHWLVINRLDGQARIFTGAPMIYKAIKNYAQNSKWGDPTQYDFEITRTEQPGSYYEVTALPDKSPLSDSEQKLVDELNIAEKKPNAVPTDEKQLDDISEWLNSEMKGDSVGSGGSGEPKGQAAARAQADKLRTKMPSDKEDEAYDKAADAAAAEAEPDKPDIIIEDIGDQPINLDDIPF